MPGGLLARFRHPDPEPEPEIRSPEPVSAPESDPPAPEPTPQPTATASLVLSCDEAVELVRSRRGDVFEIQFLVRERDRLRAAGDPSASAKADETEEHLRTVIERKLRAKGVLAPEGELELV